MYHTVDVFLTWLALPAAIIFTCDHLDFLFFLMLVCLGIYFGCLSVLSSWFGSHFYKFTR